MQFNHFTEGLEILKKYKADVTDSCAFSAEHDEFYVYCDEKINKDDKKSLKALGWEDNKDNQENSWKAFI